MNDLFANDSVLITSSRTDTLWNNYYAAKGQKVWKQKQTKWNGHSNTDNYKHYNILSATVAKTRSFSAYKQWMHNIAAKTKEVEITETDLIQAFDRHQAL